MTTTTDQQLHKRSSTPKDPPWHISIAVSIAIHAILLAALFLGVVRLAPQPQTPSPAMAVEIIPVVLSPPPSSTPKVMPKPTPVKLRTKIPPAPKLHDPRAVVIHTENRRPPKPNSPPKPAYATPPISAAPQKQTASAPTIGTPLLEAQTAEQTWMGLVGAELQRNKRYPWEAMHEGQQDVVYVHIVVDRRGKVQAAKIISSRHFPELDAEALALVWRCSPLPPPPPQVTGNTVGFDGAIDFFIKGDN